MVKCCITSTNIPSCLHGRTNNIPQNHMPIFQPSVPLSVCPEKENGADIVPCHLICQENTCKMSQMNICLNLSKSYVAQVVTQGME